MKSMIFIAPPAAGKGTQAKYICDLYHLEHISTGDLLRLEAENNAAIRKKMKAGEFISDDIIISLIESKISSLTDVKGYVLDGFPRNLNQAKAFDSMLLKNGDAIDYVIYINVDKEIAKKRIIGRLYCTSCGSTFNEYVEENKPQIKGFCNRCHASLTKREDDNLGTFEVRFDSYMKLTVPLLEYYKEKGLLYSVNGNQSTILVGCEIQKIIEGGI